MNTHYVITRNMSVRDFDNNDYDTEDVVQILEGVFSNLATAKGRCAVMNEIAAQVPYDYEVESGEPRYEVKPIEVI